MKSPKSPNHILFLICKLFVLNPIKTYNSIKGYFPYRRELRRMKALLKDCPEFKITSLYPCLLDKSDESGIMRGDYFHQDLYVAQRIFKACPPKHVDIGSRTDGFVAHVASFRDIEILDIRPCESTIEAIRFKQVDFMNTEDIPQAYTPSVSCLHALEHFGLGRYGDTMDAYGYIKGLNGLNRILKMGGFLYLSVPIGIQRIEFNAHRVFSVSYLWSLLEPYYTLEDFAYVDDTGDLHPCGSSIPEAGLKDSFGCHYGCGIFTLRKTADIKI